MFVMHHTYCSTYIDKVLLLVFICQENMKYLVTGLKKSRAVLYDTIKCAKVKRSTPISCFMGHRDLWVIMYYIIIVHLVIRYISLPKKIIYFLLHHYMTN